MDFFSWSKKGQTGVEQLYPFILLIILVGMILGIGVLTLEKFGASVSYTVYDYNDTVTLTGNGTVIYWDFGNITSASEVYNASDTTAVIVWNSSCYNISLSNKAYIVPYVLLNSSCRYFPNMQVNMIYDFEQYDTETRDAINSVTSEVAKIPSDWLGLIITIMVLSIILFLVIRSFGWGIGGERQ